MPRISETRESLSSTFAPRVGLYLPGASGNYVGVPDSASLDVAGDIQITWAGRLTSWGTGAVQSLVARWTTATNNRAYALMMSATTRVPSLWYSTDGTGNVQVNASTAFADPVGATLWIRATLDADDGAGGKLVKFYTSPDGDTWTQLGDPVSSAGTASIFDAATGLDVGAQGGGVGVYAPGVHLYAAVRAGFDGAGALVAAWDGTWPHTRQRDALGNIWTVNGTANAWQAA